MTIHQYLMQAGKDDARRAGERDRVLLEARRVGLIRRPGAGLAALVTRGVRLLAPWTGRAQDRLGKPDQAADETIMHRNRPAPDNERLGRRPALGPVPGPADLAQSRHLAKMVVLAALTCGLLATAAAVPPAFATTLRDGGLLAVSVPAAAAAQQPGKPGSPATASPCSEVCSGGGYTSANITTTPPAGVSHHGPCSEVCSGGGYGSASPPSRAPGDSSAGNIAGIPPTGAHVTESAGFHWGDAGIGAGGMLALIVIGLGGALTLTHWRNHRIHG